MLIFFLRETEDEFDQSTLYVCMENNNETPLYT
jgi:hypothetical protein